MVFRKERKRMKIEIKITPLTYKTLNYEKESLKKRRAELINLNTNKKIK